MVLTASAAGLDLFIQYTGCRFLKAVDFLGHCKFFNVRYYINQAAEYSDPCATDEICITAHFKAWQLILI